MVSIITATFKSENYLKSYSKHLQKFADFLLAKNFPFEVVIISTLPSAKEKEMLNSLAKQFWCRVIEFNTRGLYAAWNYGLSKARGDLLGFWNVDDIRFPEAIIEAASLSQKGADIIYFPFIIKRYLRLGFFSIPVIKTKIQGKILEFERNKFSTGMYCGPHFMFARDAYEKNGPFDEQFKIAGDFDWCTRAAVSNFNFALAKNYSGIFRVDGQGLSAGVNQTLQAENNVVYTRRRVKEKTVPVPEKLMLEYNISNIRVQEKWLKAQDLTPNDPY
ncbi:MAG: glycosyltransferase [Candidatus Doudnabacteria bacterium]|nr:glycosyltransferase [Candidatus Doudnabacteria bacterium]